MSPEYNSGYDAYWEGIPIDGCPYRYDPEKTDWECGWWSAGNVDANAEYFGEYYPGFEDTI